MSYKDYKVLCFKGIDYIATRENDLNKIISFYKKSFEDDISSREIQEVFDRDKEFLLINEETGFKERTTYNKLITEYIYLTDSEDFLFLCSSEW
jgi:hypothetical protein